MAHASGKQLPWVYIALMGLFLLGLGVVLLLWDKGELHLWMNGYHTPWMDWVMKYYTKVGEWVPYVVVFGLLFYKTGWATLLLTNLAVTGLIGQRLKYLFDTDRPVTWFAEHMPDVQLQLVDGVRMSQFYSCPSGHTISFVALFLTLSWLFTADKLKGEKGWQMFFFLLTILGGYSRIYLSQHFAEDIWVGAIVSVVLCLIWVPLVYKVQKTRFWDWNLRQIGSKIKKNA